MARRVGFIIVAVVVLLLLAAAWVQGGGFVGRNSVCDPGSPTACPPNFFIPLPQLSFAILFGFLLLNITSVAFALLEVRAAGGGEQKYLIARHSFITAAATAFIMAFFLVVVAFFGPAIDAELDYQKRLDMGYGSGTIRAPFDVVSDYTGSSYLDWVEVNSTDGGLFTVLVYDSDLYKDDPALDPGNEWVAAYNVSYFWVSLVDGFVKSIPEINHTVPNPDKLNGPAETQHYSIVIERKILGPSSEIVYKQSRVIDPAFVSSVTNMLLVLIIFNAAAAPPFYISRNKWRAYGQANY
jgi:hypothetical protein